MTTKWVFICSIILVWSSEEVVDSWHDLWRLCSEELAQAVLLVFLPLCEVLKDSRCSVLLCNPVRFHCLIFNSPILKTIFDKKMKIFQDSTIHLMTKKKTKEWVSCRTSTYSRLFFLIQRFMENKKKTL